MNLVQSERFELSNCLRMHDLFIKNCVCMHNHLGTGSALCINFWRAVYKTFFLLPFQLNKFVLEQHSSIIHKNLVLYGKESASSPSFSKAK